MVGGFVLDGGHFQAFKARAKIENNMLGLVNSSPILDVNRLEPMMISSSYSFTL